MKLWGRSAWALWVAYVVALVMLCEDTASAGSPRGPTGTSGFNDEVKCLRVFSIPLKFGSAHLGDRVPGTGTNATLAVGSGRLK